MLVLLAIGFVAGIVTALSPCVLPVLPIVLAGGATGRRPFAIIAGIVLSFTVFTLFAAWLLDRLGLPDDFLRNLAIAVLLVLGLSLLWPRFAELLARPLQALSRRRSGDSGGGFLLGVSLGLVFVPCAGPVLAAVTVIAAQRNVGLDGLVLTLAYAVGAALPMLAIAFTGQHAAKRLRARASVVRSTAGALVVVAALAIALGVDQDLQTRVPGYTEAVQERVERSDAAQRELQDLTGARAPEPVAGPGAESTLQDYGRAPEFAGLNGWLNSEPLTLARLRGKVVLIDFWTYSCINCLRTLPYITSWDERYRASGLTIVGVHTPEFAFERVRSNVRENAKELGIEYPIALDNDFGTWNAWHNQYWPAKYLIDRNGHVRYYHFGEGDYDESERAIRELLAQGGDDRRGDAALPPPAALADKSPRGLVTPESYLGHERLARYVGTTIAPDREQRYAFSTTLAENELTLDGRWQVEGERAVAGRDAKLRLRYRARDVYLVLTGKGSVEVLVDGRRERRVEVDGDRLYTLVERPGIGDHLLELRLAPGVAAYAFTFG
ncbi:MAG: redoxin domain-containing protein [Gaiellaceae bacterium MAG52_C11]|nr:redoxin domain-containing protein [Candidatus Gaiellasilicea maunaloa]